MNKNQVVYTNDVGQIDSSDYGTQSQFSVVVGPNVSEASYRTDGTADEVQINAAILAVNAAGGGTVILQAGTYNIVNNISLRSNITLRGQGRATKIVIPATKTIFVDVREHVTLKDFSIDALGQTGLND
jgi:polygalacturonase